MATAEDGSSSDQKDGADGARIDMVVDVMLGEPGGAPFNTVVLGGQPIGVPVERDAQADPFQDDEVWLRSVGGGVELRLLRGDEAVEQDEESGLLLYRFAHVPYGVYSVIVVTAGVPVETMRQLVVRREGVFLGDRQLAEQREGKPMAPPPGDDDGDSGEEVASVDESVGDEDGYIDQDDVDEGEDG